MSLAFLSKKTWHVTNLVNVEKVWLAEQQDKAEAAKLETWKKDREEERQIMELRQLQRESGQGEGGSGAPERVDFLYEAPTTKNEEYLLGKPVEIKPEESDIKKVEALPGASFLHGQNNLSTASNEEFNKMNNDPLLAMRAAEQAALQKILNNPMKMKQIRGAVDERKQALDRGGESRHHHHHHKDKEKHRHKEKHKEKKEKREKKDRKREKEARHRRRDDDDSGGARKRRRHSSDESESGSGSEGRTAAAPSAAAAAAAAAATAGARLPPARVAGYGLQRYSGGERLTTEPAAADAPGGAAAFVACSGFEGARPGYVFRAGESGVGYYADSAASTASAQGAGGRPLAAPTTAQPRDAHGPGGRSDAGASHHRRRGGGGGGGALSAREKEERLRQMMADADAHDAQRSARSRVDAEREKAERAEMSAAATAASADGNEAKRPAFVTEIAERVTGSVSVADRIGQQRHYAQRGVDAGAESFMRR